MGFKKETFEEKKSKWHQSILVHFPQIVSTCFDTTYFNIKALMMLKWHLTPS